MVYRADAGALRRLGHELGVRRAELGHVSGATGSLLASSGCWSAHALMASVVGSGESWLAAWEHSLRVRLALLEDGGAPVPVRSGKSHRRDLGGLAALVADARQLSGWGRLPDVDTRHERTRTIAQELLIAAVRRLRSAKSVPGPPGRSLLERAESDVQRLASALGFDVADVVATSDAMRSGLGPEEAGLDPLLFPEWYLTFWETTVGRIASLVSSAQSELATLRSELDRDANPWRDTYGEQTALLERIRELESRLHDARADIAAGPAVVVAHIMGTPLLAAAERRRAAGTVLARLVTDADGRQSREQLAVVAEVVRGLDDGAVAAALVEWTLTHLPPALAEDLQRELHRRGPLFLGVWLDRLLGLGGAAHGSTMLASALPHLTREIPVRLPAGVVTVGAREVAVPPTGPSTVRVLAVDLSGAPDLASRVTPRRILGWARWFDRVSQPIDVVFEGLEVFDAWLVDGAEGLVRETGESVVGLTAGWGGARLGGLAASALFCAGTGGVVCTVAVAGGVVLGSVYGEEAGDGGYRWLREDAIPGIGEAVSGALIGLDRSISSGRRWADRIRQ